MNFTWNPEKATLLLSVPRPETDPNVAQYAHDHGYVEKPETHLTLLSFQNGKKIIQARQGNTEEIFDLAKSYAWTFEYVPEYFVLERTIKEFVLNGQIQTPTHTRRSLIQKMVVPDMADFFAKVSEIIGVPFETPITHVTLFSWSDYEPEMTSGIAVNSEADFNAYLKEKL